MSFAWSEPVSVAGRVTGGEGGPAEGVAVAEFWGSQKGRMAPLFGATTSDADGRFTLELSWHGEPKAIMAIDGDQRHGALYLVRTNRVASPVELKLEPLVNVRGEFGCSELGEAPEWCNVYISVLPEGLRLAQDYSDPPRFDLRLPPGTYDFWGYAGDTMQDTRRAITLSADEPLLDLKVVDLKASPLGLMAGKIPPPWTVAEARGVPATVQLADYRGRWVLVEFWGYW